MMVEKNLTRYGFAITLLFGSAFAAFAQQPLPPQPVEQQAPITQQLASAPVGNLDEIRKFCGNLDNQASDARYALQAKQLAELKADVEKRMLALEEKRKEYEMWLKRRDDFVNKAQDSLVDIISKMKPDAAAAQMSLIGDEAAAALILKLNPRVSSIILNEMPPEKAAKLARVIVGSQRTAVAAPPKREQRAQAENGSSVQ
ncbi:MULTISPECIES: MotE family protein [unclassified Ochrobactrum]|uniref:MotE family protein n=1 Tax=unclassified Ochrobactrum TaxID=239106 RepID=UPI00309E2089